MCGSIRRPKRSARRTTASPFPTSSTAPECRGRVAFTVDDYTRAGIKVATKINRKVLALMGAEKVAVDTPYLSNAIIAGTTRMGTDPARSVVDADLKTHQHPNLYVLGTPTQFTAPVNAPSLTIAALGIRLAEHLNGQ